MNKEEIRKYLEENEITDIEFISEEEDMILARMFYVFDDEEIAAAENYEESLYDEDPMNGVSEEDDYGDGEMAQDSYEQVNSDEMTEMDALDELDEDEDYEEDGMMSYLSDIAIDHVGEVLEDLKEDLDVDVQYVGYYLDEENPESYEFVAMFFKNGTDRDIEEELEKLDM